MNRQGGWCVFSSAIRVSFCALLCIQSAAAEDWITEEVLKQLSEVRQELKGLKDEVRGLKESMAQSAPTIAKSKAGPINLEGAPFIGVESAQVAIIEFSDYQCPYCTRHFKQTFPDIEKNYIETGKVRYVMKQFPLGFHAKARGASIAALCVEKLKPGKYIDAHKAIFGGETSLDQSSYLALADAMGISASKYSSCLADSEMSKVVDQDMAQGKSVGVSGTPAFLVGKIKDGKLVDGRLITGARPYSSFSNVLDQIL
jgi:protein-disulfide isomerase